MAGDCKLARLEGSGLDLSMRVSGKHVQDGSQDPAGRTNQRAPSSVILARTPADGQNGRDRCKDGRQGYGAAIVGFSCGL